MRTRIGVACCTLAVLLAGLPSASAQSVQAIHEVRGEGIISTTGLPDGGNAIDQVSINAWLDETGTAQGWIIWTYTHNTLPGGGGQTVTGWPWVIKVNTLVPVEDNVVYVEGVVVHSGQQPEDEGTPVSYFVTDNGSGANDPPDELNFTPIDGGNFTVK